MTKKTYGLLFYKDYLIIDSALDFPEVTQQDGDLIIQETADRRVIARTLNFSAEEAQQLEQHDIEFPLPDWVIDLTLHEDQRDAVLTLRGMRDVLSYLPSDKFELMSRAYQLLTWQADHSFCSRCGNTTHLHAQGEFAMVCGTCHYSQYPRLQPVVIVAITKNNNEILLARSPRFKNNMFSLLAGFVEVGETLEQAVEREVFEEVGLKIKNIQYMASQPWPFPSNVMIGFSAEYDSGDMVLEEHEIVEAHFYPFDALPLTPPKGSIAHRLIQQIIQ